MIPLPQCKVVLVAGPVSSGKTYLIQQWMQGQNRVVLFDSTGEFVESDMEQIWANPKAFILRIANNPYYFRIVYQPGRRMDEDFQWVFNSLWQLDTVKLLVVDEVHRLCPAGTVEVLSSEMNILMRMARHDRMGFIGASQSVADVNRLFRSAAYMVVLFQSNEARDLEVINERWGCAEQVQGLRPLIHDTDTGVTHQVPQAVVYTKDKGVRVFDFQTDQFI